MTPPLKASTVNKGIVIIIIIVVVVVVVIVVVGGGDDVIVVVVAVVAIIYYIFGSLDLSLPGCFIWATIELKIIKLQFYLEISYF